MVPLPHSCVHGAPPPAAPGRRVFDRADWAWFLTLSAATAASVAVALRHVLSEGELTPVSVGAMALLVLWLLLWAARWLSLPLMTTPTPAVAPRGLRVAAVTTFVPSSEPLEVLESTVSALVAMEYPHHTWVLDEEGDPRVRALCERLGANYFCRAEAGELANAGGKYESGTKYGNYNVWLSSAAFARYDVIAAFDPDHVPDRDYLGALLGYFRDPLVGYVQSAPGFRNQSASFVARGAAEATYAHWGATALAAYGTGYVPLNGSHNVHRTKALQDIDGFAGHDADDYVMTASYEACGWRGVYVPRHLALGLQPSSWPAYLRQQRRWARSLVDAKLRVLPALLRHLPVRQRTAYAVHGLYYLSSAAMPLVIALAAGWVFQGRAPVALGTAWPYVLAAVVALVSCDVFRQQFLPPDQRGLHWRGVLLRLTNWPHLALGVLEGLAGRRPPYDVTPKHGHRHADRLLASSHAVAAGIVAAAWLAAVLDRRIVDPGLHAVAVAFVALSVAVVTAQALGGVDAADRDAAERGGIGLGPRDARAKAAA